MPAAVPRRLRWLPPFATLMAVLNPGDEVVVLAPFYENYGPDAVLSGAALRYVRLHEPDWRLDPDELAARNMIATDVVRALREQNVQVAAGQLGQQPTTAAA